MENKERKELKALKDWVGNITQDQPYTEEIVNPDIQDKVEELNDLLEELNLKIQDLYTDIDELLNQ